MCDLRLVNPIRLFDVAADISLKHYTVSAAHVEDAGNYFLWYLEEAFLELE